jgi:MinD-like ATPase involved in chromosome partitioning or flagellar assembly
MVRSTRKQAVRARLNVRNEVAAAQVKHMFSPASFFDVIDSVRHQPARPLLEPAAIPPRPATVAFYGFRGGAGRTVALAHIAMMLAQRGLRVAALDFDLEAPGLHIALGAEPPPEGTGLVALLSKTLTTSPDERVEVAHHLQVMTPKEGTGKVLLLPAGRVSRKYLAQIEELGVGLWHEPSLSPLERILGGLRQENPDVVLIDCRTGFSGMSASVIFHLADLAVVFLPLTDQVWDGVDVLLQAIAAARSKRDNKPGLLFVPSMVPPGEAGREKLHQQLAKLSSRYSKYLNVKVADNDEDETDLDGNEPWLRDGLFWDARISADGGIRQPFMPGGPWGSFQSLCDSIVTALDLGVEERSAEPIHVRMILDELQISGSDGFAEDLSEDQMQRIMVPSESVRAAVDRTSALVVGAKGSGKTLLWRFLVEPRREDLVRLPSDTTYVVGHAPNQSLDKQGFTLSADAFKEVEQSARMRESETYKAFWIIYGLFRLAKAQQTTADWLASNLDTSLRPQWRALVASSRSPNFVPLLNVNHVSTLAEDALKVLDDYLATKSQHYVLVFDGLDSGFQTGKPEAWYKRRERFVTGLLQVVAEWRSRLKRVQFKVFLREDIYLSIELQNRSHLDAAKHELRFGPKDLWQLALKIATTSSTYKSTIGDSKTGSDGLYVGDEVELKGLLYPLWGRTVEKGKKAYTANYILKRTSDAQGRLFPRTFIQMLDAAVKFEKQQDPRSEADRVLRFRALQDGVTKASAQRVRDLLTEYVELKPYLEALRGAPAVATPEKLIAMMKPNIGRPVLSLHMGPGGWRKVLAQLEALGLIGKKPGDRNDDEKLSVALLYRGGLGVKSAGLR